MAPETLQGLPLFAQEMQKVLLHLHTLFTCFHVKATQGHPLLLIQMSLKAASSLQTTFLSSNIPYLSALALLTLAFHQRAEDFWQVAGPILAIRQVYLTMDIRNAAPHVASTMKAASWLKRAGWAQSSAPPVCVTPCAPVKFE